MARTTAAGTAVKTVRTAATKSEGKAARPAAKKPAQVRTVAAKVAPAKVAPAKAPAARKAVRTRVATPAHAAQKAARAIAAPAKAARAKPAAGAAPARVDAPARPRLVRDSFTMPEQEYAVLGSVKQACLKAGFEVKKSELLRIGVALLGQLDMAALRMVLDSLPQLKTGRPPGE